MDRSSLIYLVKETYELDEIGQRVQRESARPVYCDVTSVSGQEWFQANQQGMKPMFRIRMFKYDYEGELIVNIGGTLEGGELTGGRRYGVYRTFEGTRRTAEARGDEIELYVEEKAGVS